MTNETMPVRSHPRLARVLIVLGSMLAFVAIYAAWIERQVLDTDEWVDTSGRLLEREEIRDALAVYAVDELYSAVDVKAELERGLPPRLQRNAGPLAAAIKQVAIQAAERILAGPRFQRAWEGANGAAHRVFLDVIEDRGPVVETGGGDVRLDLQALVADIASQLGLGERVADKLPPDVAQLEIMKANEIGTAQKIAKAINGIALITTLGTLLLLAAGIYFAGGQRWIAILGTGIGLVIAGLLVLILRGVLGDAVVQSLASPDAEPAGDAAWTVGTSLLASIAGSVLLLGIGFAIAGWLGAPVSTARRARRAIAPALRDHFGAIVLVAAIPLAIWVLSGADNTRVLLMRLILAGFVAVGLVMLRRQATDELSTQSQTAS